MSRPLIFVVLDTPAELLGVNAIEKSVLVAIVSHYNAKRNGSEVWPSKARLQALTGVSEPSVRRAVKQLEGAGYIKVQSHSGSSNVYTINFDALLAAGHPRHTDGGKPEVIHNPSQTDGGTPVTQTGDPRHTDALTANRTAKGNSISTFGCSTRLKVSENPKQRKLAVHGIVAATVNQMRMPDQEQPTGEKTICWKPGRT